MQEAGGIQLARLFQTDLASSEHCGREDCHPCEGNPGKKSNCKQSSILYESKCKVCNPDLKGSSQKEELQSRVGIYYGETSRSLYERSKEHVRDAESFSEGSHIIKHWMKHHQDEEKPEFIFSVLKTFRDCLSRQVSEAIKIHYSRDKLLNSKNEYNANCLTRVVVEEEVYERKKRERREEIEELEDKKRWEEFKSVQRQQPKRKRPEEVFSQKGWMKGKQKKLKKMESEEEDFEMAGWWEMVEGRCLRVGHLKERLENDRKRVLDRMKSRKEDALIESLGARHPSENTPNSRAFGQHSDLEVANDGVGARYPNITPNTRILDQSSSTSGIINCDTDSGQVKATHLQTESSAHFMGKRKNESSHTSLNISISSPSKKLRTKSRNNLTFLETRRLPGSGYLAGPDREFEQDKRKQQIWRNFGSI